MQHAFRLSSTGKPQRQSVTQASQAARERTCQALEGRVPDQHLKDQHTQRPVVCCTCGAAAHDDLWCLMDSTQHSTAQCGKQQGESNVTRTCRRHLFHSAMLCNAAIRHGIQTYADF